MAKELYVGHISEQATEEDLRKLFEVMGVVTSVHLIVDQDTGEFKRCGYVRMLSEADLNEVVETLDGTWLIDRCIVVSIAKPQKDRPAKTPFVRRKPPMGTRQVANEASGAGKRPLTSPNAKNPARPVAEETTKSTRSSRPAVKEAAKTGRSSAAKEAVRKFRPAIAKDAAKSGRLAPSAKRTGRPASNKQQGDGPRPPAKGRR
ncbi:MAG: RNA-binding protein [Desulfuromonadaceae bacterium]|nr:RNA-binding protein [Desulfuromonadaceae bacterium]MDD5104926.1 RNA-binding protein [Desulfuromonadaceae bacterium]